MDLSDVIVLKMTSKLRNCISACKECLQNSMYFLKIVKALASTYCLDRSISSLQLICRNCFVYLCDNVVAMVTG